MNTGRKTFSIGDTAKFCGVSQKQLRNWEARGYIPPATRVVCGERAYRHFTEGDRMNPDHFRKVVWMPALEKAGFDYRPPIQTRHTFATMMISSGEDIGWVQNMLGHSSLQMIFTRYYAWIPRSTRKDGLAFMNSVREKGEGGEPEKPRGGEKVIPLFSKSVTKTSQPTKRGSRLLAVTP